MVSVIVGPNDANVAEGKTVAELRAAFTSAYSIPAGAVAVLDGTVVGETAIPTSGQKLVFTLPTGEKG